MVIIGLLVGGILKGLELVENARVHATIAEVKKIDAAINTFYDKYDAWPGDIPNATTRIPGCDGTTFCQNGDGNTVVAGVIGSEVNYWNTRFNAAACNPNPNRPCTREVFQLWKHLALANLIAGIDPTAAPATQEWGFSHPAAPIGGGFEFYYDDYLHFGGVNTGQGNILRLSIDAIYPGAWSTNSLTPFQASRIDVKMDDSFPNTGYVIANYARLTDQCKRNNGSGNVVYNNNAYYTPSCVIYITISKRMR